MQKEILASARAARAFGATLTHKRARIFAFTGPLGSGKTTVIRGMLRALGVRGRVLSPSFLVFRRYPLRHGRYEAVYHFDLYRLRFSRELRVLDFRSILKNPHHLILIEWAERARRLIPRGTPWVSLNHGRNSRERLIRIIHRRSEQQEVPPATQ